MPFHYGEQVNKIFVNNLKSYQCRLQSDTSLESRISAPYKTNILINYLFAVILPYLHADFLLSISLFKYLLHKNPLFPKGKHTCWLGLLEKTFCISAVSVVHPTGLSFCVAGDFNPNPWLRSDEGMVSRDPWETAGSQHHGFGKQQHCCYARWIVSCMQDWTVRTRPRITRSNFVSRNSSVWKHLFWKFNSSISTAELYICQMLYCVTVMQVTNIFQSLLVAKGNNSLPVVEYKLLRKYWSSCISTEHFETMH